MVTVEASSKIAGYTFQFQRALYRLFSSESEATIIGIETDDDVVEINREPDGSLQVVFEQDKHSIQSSGHPFQDGSENLWHTLRIWLEGMNDVRKKYKNVGYCLVTNKSVPIRAFAQKMGAAIEKAEIEACINEIHQRAAHTSATGSIAIAIKEVANFSYSDLYFLIENLKLMDEYATASGADPKSATIQLFQLPPDLYAKSSDIYSSLLGLLVDTCQQGWVRRQQVWVDKSAFTKRLHLEISEYRMARYLEKPLFSTPYKDLLRKKGGNHLFLRQLQQLGIPDAHCDDAVSHYWGFYAERARLQAEGNVLPSVWDARNEVLHQRWKIITGNAKIEVDRDVSEDTLAKKIFVKTIDGNYTAKLGLHETSHPYFTSGNYHDLANVPEHTCFVYWHSLFAPEKEDGTK